MYISLCVCLSHFEHPCAKYVRVLGSSYGVVVRALATESRGVTFVRKNYPSYMLPCKIHNLVILINKFAQCNLCESDLNSFLLVPCAVFLDLDLCAHLVRHRSPHCNLLLTADHSSAVA